jgi:hypothetical protein
MRHKVTLRLSFAPTRHPIVADKLAPAPGASYCGFLAGTAATLSDGCACSAWIGGYFFGTGVQPQMGPSESDLAVSALGSPNPECHCWVRNGPNGPAARVEAYRNGWARKCQKRGIADAPVARAPWD